MKFRTVLKTLCKPMLYAVSLYALFQLLLIFLYLCGADSEFFSVFFYAPFSNSPALLAGLAILLPFRDCNRVFTQCGVSRTHAFYAYLCLLPAALLFAGIQLLAFSVLFPESYAVIGYAFTYAQPSAALYAWSIFLSVLRYMALGFMLGAILLRLPQKSIFLLIPAAGICGYIYFMLVMVYSEGGGFGYSLFGSLFFLENAMFPAIALAARDLSAAVIFLSVGRLLMRGAPVKS